MLQYPNLLSAARGACDILYRTEKWGSLARFYDVAGETEVELDFIAESFVYSRRTCAVYFSCVHNWLSLLVVILCDISM